MSRSALTPTHQEGAVLHILQLATPMLASCFAGIAVSSHSMTSSARASSDGGTSMETLA